MQSQNRFLWHPSWDFGPIYRLFEATPRHAILCIPYANFCRGTSRHAIPRLFHAISCRGTSRHAVPRLFLAISCRGTSRRTITQPFHAILCRGTSRRAITRPFHVIFAEARHATPPLVSSTPFSTAASHAAPTIALLRQSTTWQVTPRNATLLSDLAILQSFLH